MTIKMKAQRDFRGRDGEGTNLASDRRLVEAGGEMTVADQGRANWLEVHGLAIPVGHLAAAPAPRAATVQNLAEEAGPLASAGGQTGAEAAASSSPAAPARKRPVSRSRNAVPRS
jgi:hypothetical protein